MIQDLVNACQSGHLSQCLPGTKIWPAKSLQREVDEDLKSQATEQRKGQRNTMNISAKLMWRERTRYA